jgi:hypothetical protein
MKKLLLCVLAIAGAGLMQASIIESISFDLSDLHPGSTLSGTFTLSNSPMSGDTAPVALTFSDPSDYSPTSLVATIMIGSGTTLLYTVDFSPLTFTNLSGSLTPINTKEVDLTTRGIAQCASFPCTATGGLQDNSPAVFTSTYAIAPVLAPVPEPGYGMIIPVLLVGFLFGKRVVRAE